MAASAYPDGDDDASGQGSGSGGGAAADNGNSVTETLPQQTYPGLRHDYGLAVQWTPEEQSLLEQLLAKYEGEPSIPKYNKISKEIPGKLVRDIAMRCRWMTKKETGKRRKDDNLSGKRNKEKKEKVADPSTKSPSHSKPSNVASTTPSIPADNDDGISFKAIGGVTGELLEQNAQWLNQISANQASHQIADNINIFCKIRDNISTILNSTEEAPEIMKQMPPLHVKIDENLASLILPPKTQPKS